MIRLLIALGALLLAAPAFSLDDSVLTFSLKESKAQISARLGPPALVAPAGQLESWQYQDGIADHHEFSHLLLFRGGTLISFTRNFDAPADLSALFPHAESSTEHYPDARHPAMSFRVRRLGDDRVLLALGDPAATEQILLIRASELRHFHPWLAARLFPAQ